MLTVIILNIVAVSLAQVAAVRRSERWLAFAFFVVFVFLALRYDYGNDYLNYRRYFEEAGELSGDVRLELGWQMLCVLFQPVGFFTLVAAVSAFNVAVYHHFIARYVPASHYGYAVFLYVFNPYFMLVQSSAMRQSVAICIFLLALRFVERRSLWKFALCVGLAATFHASAVALLPVYWLARSGGRMRGLAALGVFASYVIAVLSAGALRPFVGAFVAEYVARYEMYEGGTELGTGLGLLYASTVLAVVLYAGRGQVEEKGMLFRLGVISYFASVPLGMINTAAGRMGMYFTPSLLAVLPHAANSLRDRRMGTLFLASYAAMTLYGFYVFFQSDVWSVPFGTYKTILSAPGFY
jgi:uncharacterized protein YqgC (DUF456 family)